MIPVPVPVPPMLEQALGIPPDAGRLVGIFWTPCGDEVSYDDGRVSGTGPSWAFLAYARHICVEPWIGRFNIGSSDRDADHWLVLDRTARTIAVAEVPEARRVLHGQWPPTEPMTLTDAELDQIMARLASRPMPTADQIAAAIMEQRRLEHVLADWLDRCPQAEAGREAFRKWVEGN